jgi:molecular chaperone DnaK
MDYLMEDFQSMYDIDISDDNRAIMRLKDEAEKCKIVLSSEPEYKVSLPFFAEYCGNPVSLEKTITRELFEDLIMGKIESTKKQIDIALSDSGLKKQDVDLILLVGGSTRIPFVKQFIERTLGKVPEILVDPDLAVVRVPARQISG